MSDDDLTNASAKLCTKATDALAREIDARVRPQIQKAWDVKAPDEQALVPGVQKVRHISDAEYATIMQKAQQVTDQMPIVGEAEKESSLAWVSHKIERLNLSALSLGGVFLKHIRPQDAQKQLDYAAKGSSPAVTAKLVPVLEAVREDILAAQSDGDVRVSDAETKAMYDKAVKTMEDEKLPANAVERVKRLIPYLAISANVEKTRDELEITNDAAYRESRAKMGKPVKGEKQL